MYGLAVQHFGVNMRRRATIEKGAASRAGKYKGYPRFKTNNSSHPNRGLSEPEIDKFFSAIQRSIANFKLRFPT